MVTAVSTGDCPTSAAIEMNAVASGISASLWTYKFLAGLMGVIGKVYHISLVLCIKDVFD